MDSSLQVRIESDRIRIGRHLAVEFERTLRIPDDGHTYPLPPGLGTFPICRIEDYASAVPTEWLEDGGAFIPMYQREALWLYFTAPYWRPCAVKVGLGSLNAISGKAWDHRLRRAPQDYVVCPDQPWLDGINAGDGFIRQFVAAPLHTGQTVEAQVAGEDRDGGMRIASFAPKTGRFPDASPRDPLADGPFDCLYSCATELGLGAGGRMRQQVYPDEYGNHVWDRRAFGEIHVRIVNSTLFREITDREPPPSPIDAETYTRYGLPWFDLYDEGRGDLAPSEELGKVKTISELAPTIDVPDGQVVKLPLGKP